MPKTIVITGTATGMGRATVIKFAAQGWNVVATVRKDSDLEAHSDLRCVKTLLLDVDDEAASVPFAQRALEQFGRAAVALLSESLNIELAEFGVIVRTVLPGMSATRIFTKIDRGDSIPDAYQASIARFFASNSSTGSDPAVTADVIYRAVIDPDPTAVRYYSAPDSASIPRGKRILGLDGYWREFRRAVLGCPSDLWQALMEKPDSTPVDMEV